MAIINKVGGLAVFFLWHFCSGALAAGATIGDPVAGKDKAALCEGCHGGMGNSESSDFPRLAGQYAGYIVKQVKDFQSTLRANNETMAGIAAGVTDMQDLKDIASYFSQQKMVKEPLAKVDSKKASKGEEIFLKGKPEKDLYACVNCHGERGKGKAANVPTFPVIGGQHRDYLVKNLKEFQSGGRVNDPAMMMGDIAKKMSAEDIEAVAEYLSSQLP